MVGKAVGRISGYLLSFLLLITSCQQHGTAVVRIKAQRHTRSVAELA